MLFAYSDDGVKIFPFAHCGFAKLMTIILGKEGDNMNNFNFSSFLNFDKMLTPTIIKIVFWIGAGLSVLMGLLMIIQGAGAYYGGGASIFMGLLTIVIGPFVVRIYCELLIIFFKMNETLHEVKNLLAHQNKPVDNEENKN